MTTSLPEEVVVYTDGASRGNPGPAALGIAILDTSGNVLHEIRQKLGDQTNNYAEYMALKEGLAFCEAAGVSKVTVKADSQLMVRQMLGEYKVKAEGIIPIYLECKKLSQSFSEIRFEHVRREDNKHADRLANEALDGHS